MLLGLILIVVTLTGCTLFAFRPAWFPVPISFDAIAYDRQFTWTLWIAGLIFVAAQLLLAWSIFRGHRTKRASGFTASSRWELAWTVATSILFLGLAVSGSRGWAKTPVLPAARNGAGTINEAVTRKEVIHVESHQFAWNFHYPGPDRVFGRTGIEFISDASGNPVGLDPKDRAGRDDIVTSTLRIPARRDVLLLLHSRDVIHDFFVRELRTKQDIVPGMEIPLELHVETPGSYEIACAELCGLGHSQMRSVMIVMPPDRYDAWKAGEISK